MSKESLIFAHLIKVCAKYKKRVYTMEQSFIAFLEDSIKKTGTWMPLQIIKVPHYNIKM